MQVLAALSYHILEGVSTCMDSACRQDRPSLVRCFLQVVILDPMYDGYASMCRRSGATLRPLRSVLEHWLVYSRVVWFCISLGTALTSTTRGDTANHRDGGCAGWRLVAG